MVGTKNLEAIIADIIDESNLRNPVHRRRMNLLRVKRNGAPHSDFFITLEEQFWLVDYEIMTGQAFFTHPFLEQSDPTMAKEAREIIATKPQNDINSLRSQIKATEASL